MRKFILASVACALFLTTGAPAPAEACGGFFCGQQPADQAKEIVVFGVNEDTNTTDMIVQVSYMGDAADFAWVLPLAEVPVDGSLDTFPMFALNALDARTGPQLSPDWGDCFDSDSSAAPMAGGRAEEDGDVTVHTRENVGPYDVAVLESENADALIEWLRDNDFRVTSAMEPYMTAYTEEGMKFLALRLQPESKVSDIAPFKLTLPGTSPGIPLRLTSIAAEPEMGILTIILGSQRYQGANWGNVEVPDDYLAYDWTTGRHNWPVAVARVVDEAGGQGWVTELAGSNAEWIGLLERTMPSDPEQAEAISDLLGLMRPHAYITRLYTRLSAEEMTSDPTFRRSAGEDVSRFRTIPSDGETSCGGWWGPGEADTRADADPCAFVTCGAGGRCAEVERADGTIVAGCACVPGATARTTTSPSGGATTICQDQSMSFLNAGDVELPGATPIPDACIGFECGSHGTCVAVNMTPTCVCDQGYVALGAFTDEGGRLTSCVAPRERVGASFYDRRLPERSLELPTGRTDTILPAPTDMVDAGCSAAGGAGGHAGWLAFAALGLMLRRRR